MAKKKSKARNGGNFSTKYVTINRIIIFFTFLFVLQTQLLAQITDLSKLINETQIVAEKTTSQALFEFVYDFKVTVEKKGEKISTETYEAVCAEKRCEYILVGKDGKTFSENEIANKRKKAAARLDKSEKSTKTDFFLARKFVPPYDFLLLEKINRVNVYFNPNFYLKTCKINLIENSLLENRQTIKVSATKCKDASENNKKRKFIPPKTEALIWIDKKDKAVVKLEIYGENEIQKANGIVKPTVILEAAIVPEGFWFWKNITVNTDNKNFFKKKSGNRAKMFGNRRTIEFYNYKKFNVAIKAEVNEKQN